MQRPGALEPRQVYVLRTSGTGRFEGASGAGDVSGVVMPAGLAWDEAAGVLYVAEAGGARILALQP